MAPRRILSGITISATVIGCRSCRSAADIDTIATVIVSLTKASPPNIFRDRPVPSPPSRAIALAGFLQATLIE